ncbi:MAG: SPOR domain-containing protein [Woeseiaceae bacterium]
MKERIIGAAVLVLFAVLVVPVFLDGPPVESEVVSERVLLPGQESQKTQTVVLERNRTEPVPIASAQPAPEPVKKPAVATPKAAQQTAAEETAAEEAPQPVVKPAEAAVKSEPKSASTETRQAPPKPAAASTTGMWAVQLGSFSSKENAENLAASLRKQGYAAFLSQLSTDAGQLHRVRIGPQKDRESAEAMASRLRKVGQEGQVVPHP